MDEVIEVREWDGPDGAGGRCWCTGVFDFVIDLACLPRIGNMNALPPLGQQRRGRAESARAWYPAQAMDPR